MSSLVRAARPEEAEAILEVLSLAFGLDRDAARPLFYADPYYDLLHKRVLSLPGAGVVSCLTLVPARLRIGGVPVPAAGVAGVATRPAFQRRGYAGTLLAATLPQCAALGFPLALLHPVSAPFYRRLGWEYASRHVRWLSAPSSLPHHAEAAHAEAAAVRPATAEDWPALEALHDKVTCTGTGSFQRDPRRWTLIRMPIPGRETVVAEIGGVIVGYCIYERSDSLHVLEMACVTEQAGRSLIGFLAGQPDALLEWTASPALLDRFGLSRVGFPEEPGVMLRILDLEAALAALNPIHYAPVLRERGVALTLHAADPICTENTRPICLTADGVIPGTRSGGPWLHADIRIFCRLYLGDLLPSEAAAKNSLVGDSPQTLVLADRLFPRREPYVAPLDQF